MYPYRHHQLPQAYPNFAYERRPLETDRIHQPKGSQSSSGDLATARNWPTAPSPHIQINSPWSSHSGFGLKSEYLEWSRPQLQAPHLCSYNVNLDVLPHAFYGGNGSASGLHAAAQVNAQHRTKRDEFDGPAQYLEKPDDHGYEQKESEMPELPISLRAEEQDEILSEVNDSLSQCAFDFFAKYQFPIPIEPDKRPVCVASDREWSEWVYLLKRLATKRRIPARVLYNGQIKQLITVLENSLEMRHAAKHQSRPLKDDRNVLQLVSSGIQVAKILKDGPAMRVLDILYAQAEKKIQLVSAMSKSLLKI